MAFVTAFCLLSNGCSRSPSESSQRTYVVVDASISAGRDIELFVDDFRNVPYRRDIVPRVRRTYVFGPLERPPRRLRLDPSNEAGAAIALYGITVKSAGRQPAKITAQDLGTWLCDGVTDVQRSVEALTLRSVTNDPTCISPALALTTSSGTFRRRGLGEKLLGAGFILGLVVLALAAFFRLRHRHLAPFEPEHDSQSPACPPAGERRIRRYLWFLTVSYVANALIAIAADRHLYADGSAYLLYDILVGGHFVYPQRLFSYVYYQGPTLLAIEAGIRSVRVLSWLYGGVLFSPPILGTWLSWWVCRRTDIKLVFFPAFCCLSVLLSWMFYPMTEVHLTVSSFWPLFCFALAWRPTKALGLPAIIAGMALLLLFGLSHDAALFLGPLLAGLAWWRLRAMPQWRVRAAVMAIGLAGVAATVGHMALNVASLAVNDSTFLTGLMYLGTNKLLVMNVFALACAVLCFVPGVRDRGAAVMSAAICAVGFYVLFGILTQSLELKPWSHQGTRAAAPLVAMLMAGIVAWLFKSRFWADANWDQMWRVAAITFAVGVGWHAFATSQWVGYRRIFVNELRKSDGLIEFETTGLARDQYGQQILQAMTFMWELPHQSILWSEGEVNSILYSKRMKPLSEILGRRELPELAAFDRFVEPRIVP